MPRAISHHHPPELWHCRDQEKPFNACVFDKLVSHLDMFGEQMLTVYRNSRRSYPTHPRERHPYISALPPSGRRCDIARPGKGAWLERNNASNLQRREQYRINHCTQFAMQEFNADRPTRKRFEQLMLQTPAYKQMYPIKPNTMCVKHEYQYPPLRLA